MQAPTRVVIIGGGFAGREAAKRFIDQPVQITLIDKRNFHLFQPLLYQVATGTLAGGDIIAPLRMSFNHADNITVKLQTVTDLDVSQQNVILGNGEKVPYDYLVVAAGSQTSYFNNAELARKLPGLKTLEDAEAIRQRILLAFEQAEVETNPERRQALLTFVVVGGGPTGVELSGAISELATQTLAQHYKNIHCEDVKIILVEGIDRILQPYSPALSRVASERLAELNVTLQMNRILLRMENDCAILKHGDVEETLRAETIIWTAGVEGVPLGKIISDKTGCPLSKRKTLTVQSDFSIPNHPNIFVVGDLCDYRLTNYPPLPGVAPAAIQAGRYVAEMILHLALDQQVPPSFQYHDKGSLAVIGKGSAVAQLGKTELSGLVAWLLWAGVHIFTLIGFGNRVRVGFNWLASYLLNRNGFLIIRDETSLNHPPDPEKSLVPSSEKALV